MMRWSKYPEAVFFCAALLVPARASADWFRGNTHTHTLNSDGNVSPDTVVRWYREHGYQFVVITDHEFVTDVAPLQAQFGADEKFLVIKGQEITQAVRDPAHPDGERQAHVNAINAGRVIMPMLDSTGDRRFARTFPAPKDVPIARTFARNLAEIRAAGGIGQINHPNFRWSLGLEDLVDVPDQTLYELWNGQPEINNLGGTDENGQISPSTEALWDALLSRGKRIWAVASDDSHFFRNLEEANGAPPGQGWIVVRAERLTAKAITAALTSGDFYASNGVTLDDYAVTAKEISLKIKRTTKLASVTPDVRFVTRFIGRGGRVLSAVPGLEPKYSIRGDEGYVRASITDSNGRRAWTQPVFVD